jgi:hypothetical protein
MQRFLLEQSGDFYTSHSGLALVGLCLDKYTDMNKQLSREVGVVVSGASHSDVLRSYIGLLSIGKSDYDAIRNHRDDTSFKKSLGIKRVPSPEILRQRLDKHAEPFRRVVERCSVELLRNANVPVSAVSSGHVPVDIDVFPMDNSDTKKEGVSRTYHNTDGYAPIAAYLGQEGWCLEIELRPGSQHSQKGFIPFLERVLHKARMVTGGNRKLLVRLDSAHDAVETRATLREQEGISYILKWNPRKEDTAALAARAFSEGRVSTPREGKRVALLTTWQEQEHDGQTYRFTKVLRATERTIDKKGQRLLVPELVVEGWWSNLVMPPEHIIRLYEDHGLSEQFHSEFKTDLDLERLPSGKFATNALVMALAVMAYNILRYIGQLGLLGEVAPVRHPAKRRRIRTVIQELIYMAGRLVSSGRRWKLRFGRHCPGFQAFALVYNRLALA